MAFVYEDKLRSKKETRKSDNTTCVCIEKNFSEGRAELSDFKYFRNLFIKKVRYISMMHACTKTELQNYFLLPSVSDIEGCYH